MMKLYLLIILFATLFMMGCSQNDSTIHLGNENLDEKKSFIPEFKCSNECTLNTNSCNKENEILICINNSKGCSVFENQGVQIGKCEVECIEHTNCKGENICRNNKCIEKDTKYFTDLIKNKDMSYSYNKEDIREYFYLKVNELRYKKGKKEIEISPIIEKSSNECATKSFWTECEIEHNQVGVNWQIPWYSNVIGCGFAETSKSNIDCLFSSLEEDTDLETRIYEELLTKNKIGIGIINKGEDISYSITLE